MDDDLTGLIAETLYDHRNSQSFNTPHYDDDEYDCCARAVAVVVNEHYRIKVSQEIDHVIFEIEDLRNLFSD